MKNRTNNIKNNNQKQENISIINYFEKFFDGFEDIGWPLDLEKMMLEGAIRMKSNLMISAPTLVTTVGLKTQIQYKK